MSISASRARLYRIIANRSFGRGEVTLAFAFHGPVLDQAIEERGDMPLPPYIAGKRPADEQGTIRPLSAETAIFITPGYRFRAVDLMLTNFHLPRSTLFMLVAAFSGLDTMKRAYAHAIAAGYRFYSYGDACLLHRAAS